MLISAKKEGSFDTIKSFCVYKYKVQGLNLFNLSLNQFSPPVKYRQCYHSEAHGCQGPVHATQGALAQRNTAKR